MDQFLSDPSVAESIMAEQEPTDAMDSALVKLVYRCVEKSF